MGEIKTRIAFEKLLARGIGDTLRVSLTLPNDRKHEEVLVALRRLDDADRTTGHLIRAMPRAEVERGTIRVLGGGNAGENNQITVVDINNLHDRAAFRRVIEKARRSVEGRSRPLVLVLDELNKYAPREGWSPIEVILDIADAAAASASSSARSRPRARSSAASRRTPFRVADGSTARRLRVSTASTTPRGRERRSSPGTMFCTSRRSRAVARSSRFRRGRRAGGSRQHRIAAAGGLRERCSRCALHATGIWPHDPRSFSPA
jgi:hypothetical protein